MREHVFYDVAEDISYVQFYLKKKDGAHQIMVGPYPIRDEFELVEMRRKAVKEMKKRIRERMEYWDDYETPT